MCSDRNGEADRLAIVRVNRAISGRFKGRLLFFIAELLTVSHSRNAPDSR